MIHDRSRSVLCITAVTAAFLTPMGLAQQEGNAPAKAAPTQAQATAAQATPAQATQAPTTQPAPVPTLQEAQRLMQAGNLAEASAAFARIVDADPDSASGWFFLGYSLHGQGKLGLALPAHLMAAEFTEAQTAPIAMYNVACVYSLRDNADKAFDWLEKARDAGFRNPGQLQSDTDMDNIREDPRFEAFMRSLSTRGSSPARAAAPTRAEDIAALEPRRQFDFWIGAWNVFVPSGDQAGSNRIELALDGNLILEHWQSERGSTGSSMNYYDAGTKEWVQVWVDQEGESIVMRGGFKEGAMRLEGTRTLPDGATSRIRGAWEPMSAGRIRQFIEESKDDGATWAVWFDGTYVRR